MLLRTALLLPLHLQANSAVHYSCEHCFLAHLSREREGEQGPAELHAQGAFWTTRDRKYEDGAKDPSIGKQQLSWQSLPAAFKKWQTLEGVLFPKAFPKEQAADLRFSS